MGPQGARLDYVPQTTIDTHRCFASAVTVRDRRQAPAYDRVPAFGAIRTRSARGAFWDISCQRVRRADRRLGPATQRPRRVQITQFWTLSQVVGRPASATT